MPRLLPCLLLLLAGARANADRMGYDLFDLVADCHVIVRGRVVVVGRDDAQVEVARTWKRSLPAGPILVAPATASSCTGRYPNLEAGEEVFLFLRAGAEGEPFGVLADGHGKFALAWVDEDEFVAALETLLPLAGRDEDGLHRAMLELATHANATVRRTAHMWIQGKLSASPLRERYRDPLVALLDAADPATRRAALYGLQHVRAPEAVGVIIRLTTDPDLRVVDAASMALAHYDRRETVEALIRLADHDSPDVRIRALIDLQTSRNVAALETFLASLEDPEPRVRRVACTRLPPWIRPGVGDGDPPQRTPRSAVADRVAELLITDPSEEVRAGAARVLGGSGLPACAAPLQRALTEADPASAVEQACLDALGQLWTQGGAEGKRRVEARLDLVLRSLRRGTGGLAPVWLLTCLGRTEDLAWAARFHPDAAVRREARRCLAVHRRG